MPAMVILGFLLIRFDIRDSRPLATFLWFNQIRLLSPAKVDITETHCGGVGRLTSNA